MCIFRNFVGRNGPRFERNVFLNVPRTRRKAMRFMWSSDL